jgi:2-hydroxyglutarate dehydrogenase
MMSCDFCVVGGGIVGLAVAARLSQFGTTVLLEKNNRLADETSARNSGVVHAGIYYPPRSLKTLLSIEGNRNIWNLQAAFPGHIQAKKIGKWIGAVNPSQLGKLEKIATNMKALGVPLRSLTQQELREKEPNVRLCEAIESPNTGIIDVVSLANFFESAIAASKTESLVATRALVNRVDGAKNSKVEVTFTTPPSSGSNAGETTTLVCRNAVMSAGLHTTNFWNSGGFHLQSGEQIPLDLSTVTHYCKGRYVGYRDSGILSRLVYPCPLENLKGLGVHSIVDIAGGVRFGADAHYVDNWNDISVSDDPLFIDQMFEVIREFIPSIKREKMFVDFAGIRPKLSSEGEPFRDFHIQPLHASLPQVLLLAGIESPGLTSCTAIADYVARCIVSEAEFKSIAALWHA